nr:efflux transporter outer membrane subunit [Burkholderia gladioli]
MQGFACDRHQLLSPPGFGESVPLHRAAPSRIGDARTPASACTPGNALVARPCRATTGSSPRLDTASAGPRAEPVVIRGAARQRAAAILLQLLPLALSACMLGPDYRAPDAAALKLPDRWRAALPHGGSLVELARWWRQFDDPVMSALIDAAQADSPTIDAAVARMGQARATRLGSLAGLLPKIDGVASFNRSNGNTQAVTSSDVTSTNTSIESGELDTSRAGLQASWELDWFGKNRRRLQGDDARIASRRAQWHDARISVAADVADAYLRTRACEALVEAGQDDQRSRLVTAEVTRQRVMAGFLAPSDDAQPTASIAEGEEQLLRQRTECEIDRNELVALTGLSREALDARLAAAHGSLPVPREATVTTLPAGMLEQRPDLRAAERTLAASSAEIGEALAARLPSLSLSGSIDVYRYQVTGQGLTLRPWMFGPTLNLPIFDGGSGAARVIGAREQYREMLADYQQKARQAVREVEDAMVRVNTAAAREQSAQIARDNYGRYAQNLERRFSAGSSDVLDVETARRQYVTSRQSVIAARLERGQAWVALYRAVGGGWQQDGATTAAGSGRAGEGPGGDADATARALTVGGRGQ